MIRLFVLSLILVCASSVVQSKEKQKVLFIVTSVEQMNSAPNGTYLIELAVPFDAFVRNDIEIDIVSPLGGKIPIYHNGETPNAIDSIVDSALFKSKTNNSLKPTEVAIEEYSAVIIPGGYGQFWDTHKNQNIQKIIAATYERGGPIGTIGHGTASLIDVKLSSGEYLVNGKTMTSFPTWNEKNVMKQSNYGDLLPYDMEIELQKRGANLKIYDHQKKINYEVVDYKNRLVTASFAGSGQFLAEEIA